MLSNPMQTSNNYQFIVDDIPDDFLEEFINLMHPFVSKCGCKFSYKEGKSYKFPLLPVNANPPYPCNYYG